VVPGGGRDGFTATRRLGCKRVAQRGCPVIQVFLGMRIRSKHSEMAKKNQVHRKSNFRVFIGVGGRRDDHTHSGAGSRICAVIEQFRRPQTSRTAGRPTWVQVATGLPLAAGHWANPLSRLSSASTEWAGRKVTTWDAVVPLSLHGRALPALCPAERFSRCAYRVLRLRLVRARRSRSCFSIRQRFPAGKAFSFRIKSEECYRRKGALHRR
jgi:hypothetical protein